MLEQEFKYYLDHQAELVKKYDGKVLVIVGDQIIGAFESNKEAYDAAKINHEPGTFLIQRCSEGTADYTKTFFSRVSF